MTNKFDKFLLTGLSIAYLVSRLVNLTIIPIFTDEAIYLRWSQLMSRDWFYKFLPLTDGKPPLFMWLVALVMKLFSTADPLIIGRIVSVSGGLVAMWGVYFAASQLFQNKLVSRLSALFYLVIPFGFFYDRIGLDDTLLAALAVWSLGLVIRLVRKPSLKLAIILGIVNGLGLWTKTPAMFFILYLPLSLLVFDFKKPSWKKSLASHIAKLFLASAISLAMFFSLSIMPEFSMIFEKNHQFAIPLSEFLRNPLLLFSGNIGALLRWESVYLTGPVVIGILVLTAVFFREKTRGKLILTLYFLFFLLFVAGFNKVIYPRYISTFTPMLLILLSVGLGEIYSRFKSKLILLIVVLVLVIKPMMVDYQLLTNPVYAEIPDNDAFSYLNGWPAGWGMKETVNFFSAQTDGGQKVTVGTEGTFGLMPEVLYLYQDKYPTLEIISYWPLPNPLPEAILKAAKDHPTYFIVYQHPTPPQWNVKEVLRFKTGTGTDSLRVYRVNP